MEYEINGRHVLEIENADLTLNGLLYKLDAALEAKDYDLVPIIAGDIELRTR